MNSERKTVGDEQEEDWIPLTPPESFDASNSSSCVDPVEDIYTNNDGHAEKWLHSLALFGDSKLALTLSSILFAVAIAVALYVEGGIPFLETLPPSEIAYRELGPVPVMQPATIFEIEKSQGSKSLVSDEMHAAYKIDGVIAVRGILDPKDLDALDLATLTIVEEQHKKNARRAQEKPKVLTGRKPPASQFYTVRQNAIFQPAENENVTSAFVKVAMMSDIPAIAADLLQFDLDTCTNQTVRILRDIFLAKDEEEYVCGWHVDDIGFWPALADAPGVNAWVALDDMPVALGGGFALAAGSHKSVWRHDAYDLIGSAHSFPPEGYTSSHDILQKRPGNGTCNIRDTAPHLNRRMEEMKRVYDIRRGDVIFHDRWLFHRTVPFERNVVSERSRDETPLLYRRYSIRFGPGGSVVPPGWGVEPSVISDHNNGGRTIDDVSKHDAPWYPKVWPVVDALELEAMKILTTKRLPEAVEKSEQRKRVIRPRRKNQH